MKIYCKNCIYCFKQYTHLYVDGIVVEYKCSKNIRTSFIGYLQWDTCEECFYKNGTNKCKDFKKKPFYKKIKERYTKK